MSQKSSYEDKLNKLYKELFVVQFIHPDEYKEQDVINRIRRLEEAEGPVEAYRESVRADGATI